MLDLHARVKECQRQLETALDFSSDCRKQLGSIDTSHKCSCQSEQATSSGEAQEAGKEKRERLPEWDSVELAAIAAPWELAYLRNQANGTSLEGTGSQRAEVAAPFESFQQRG